MHQKIILLTVDCLRADQLIPGQNKNKTPNIDYLIKNGVIFKRAYATSPWTPSSFKSIFSSEMPYDKGGYLNVYDCKTFPEVLQRNGYVTLGFHSNPWLGRVFGYSKGFDYFYEGYTKVVYDRKKNSKKGKNGKFILRGLLLKQMLLIRILKLVRSSHGTFRNYLNNMGLHDKYLDGKIIIQKALTHIRKNKSEKFFIWIHFMDTHEPHQSRKKSINFFRNMRINDINRRAKRGEASEVEKKKLYQWYREDIQYVDHLIGILLKELRKINILSQTNIVLLGDHGQLFMEKDGFGHGHSLNHKLLHVPLIYCKYGMKPTCIETPVSLIKVPTDILKMSSSSCIPTGDNTDVIFSEHGGSESIKKHNWQFDGIVNTRLELNDVKISIIKDNWQYIYESNGQEELYDTTSGSFGSNNMLSNFQDRALIEFFRKKVSARMNSIKLVYDDIEPKRGKKITFEDEKEINRRLEDLGYL